MRSSVGNDLVKKRHRIVTLLQVTGFTEREQAALAEVTGVVSPAHGAVTRCVRHFVIKDVFL